MAEDTRQDSSSDAQTSASKPTSYNTSTYDRFLPPAPGDNPNVIPGGMANTAEGRLGSDSKDLTVVDAVKSIRAAEFTELHTKPCVKDSTLTGIGAGFTAGGLVGIWGKGIWRACNWAVGTFAIVSLASFQLCKIRRQMEKDGMKRVIEVYDRKKKENREKKAEGERLVELQAREEEERRLQEERKKSWKFW